MLPRRFIYLFNLNMFKHMYLIYGIHTDIPQLFIGVYIYNICIYFHFFSFQSTSRTPTLLNVKIHEIPAETSLVFLIMYFCL